MQQKVACLYSSCTTQFQISICEYTFLFFLLWGTILQYDVLLEVWLYVDVFKGYFMMLQQTLAARYMWNMLEIMENFSTFKFFIHSGLQELGVYKPLYFVLAFVLYILIITVNLTLILIVTIEKSLHEPMYIFLSNLCVNGLYGTVGFYPKFLLDLQSDVHTITYSWCIIQA